MKIWQVDFYRRPLQDEAGKALWELVACDPTGTFVAQAFCSSSEVSADWVRTHLKQFAEMSPTQMRGSETKTSGTPIGLPDHIHVFRPQALSLLQTACQSLHITVEPTRHTPALKQLLQESAAQYVTLPHFTGQPYNPIDLEKPPPIPLPEALWGERWQFAALAAVDLVSAFQNRPIPILEMPESRSPVQLKLPSTLPIPGVIIEAGRRSMQLARWLQQTHPYALTYLPGDPDGLVLEAGLVDRWVLTTFTDTEVITAARSFRERQQTAKGLHFLLVQPDNSGMTYSGFWLLQLDES